jgi:hypothetical protein
LINVLEVLKDRRPASAEAQDLVERWKAQAKATLDPDEAESIRGNLEWLKNISIARGIASLVARHLDPTRAREAKDLYTLRSKLVHDGERLLDPAATLQLAETLTTELLARILQSGTLESAGEGT